MKIDRASNGVTYDAAGNLTVDGTGTGSISYTWDAEGRMSSAAVNNGATVSFTYNALGQRVMKNISSGTDYRYYYYDPFGTLAFIRNNPYVLEDFFPPVAGRNYGKYGDSVTYFLHTNLLGSTGAVTDQTGATLQDQLYYPWGQQWSSVGTSKDVRFASLKERDSETGLDPTFYRIYSSNIGRWHTPDPVRGCFSSPQSQDRYAYVRNNPPNLTDPSGLIEIGGVDGAGYPGIIWCPNGPEGPCYDIFLPIISVIGAVANAGGGPGPECDFNAVPRGVTAKCDALTVNSSKFTVMGTPSECTICQGSCSAKEGGTVLIKNVRSTLNAFGQLICNVDYTVAPPGGEINLHVSVGFCGKTFLVAKDFTVTVTCE